MDERKQQRGAEEERPRDDLRLPDEQVEDLELDDDQSADVKGGYFLKVDFRGDGG